ncbi:hypothetical protein [Bradyrhizobium sp. WSM3983]|uniref:hypothetical protein n=1 Tax=Bradyrhizobium sp. WSM3983 TaxID=1038867 RepID=UPI0012EBC977|nr:hypothetical protein [Bradyrhizobium sp. WSM3983]
MRFAADLFEVAQGRLTSGVGSRRAVFMPNWLVCRDGPVLGSYDFTPEPHQIALQPDHLQLLALAAPKQCLSIRAHAESVEMASHVLLLCRADELRRV